MRKYLFSLILLSLFSCNITICSAYTHAELKEEGWKKIRYGGGVGILCGATALVLYKIRKNIQKSLDELILERDSILDSDNPDDQEQVKMLEGQIKAKKIKLFWLAIPMYAGGVSAGLGAVFLGLGGRDLWVASRETAAGAEEEIKSLKNNEDIYKTKMLYLEKQKKIKDQEKEKANEKSVIKREEIDDLKRQRNSIRVNKRKLKNEIKNTSPKDLETIKKDGGFVKVETELEKFDEEISLLDEEIEKSEQDVLKMIAEQKKDKKWSKTYDSLSRLFKNNIAYGRRKDNVEIKGDMIRCQENSMRAFDILYEQILKLDVQKSS